MFVATAAVYAYGMEGTVVTNPVKNIPKAGNVKAMMSRAEVLSAVARELESSSSEGVRSAALFSELPSSSPAAALAAAHLQAKEQRERQLAVQAPV